MKSSNTSFFSLHTLTSQFATAIPTATKTVFSVFSVSLLSHIYTDSPKFNLLRFTQYPSNLSPALGMDITEVASEHP